MKRAYVLLDVMDGYCDFVMQVLRSRTGVIMVDETEGPADIVMVVEASDRHELAGRTVRALAAVEDMTMSMQLLPARGDGVAGYKNRDRKN